MMARLAVLLAALLAVVASGCVMMSRDLSSLRQEIERSNPGLELRRNIVINAGGGLLHTMERMAGWMETEESESLRSMLNEIDRLKLGVYDVRWHGNDRMADLSSVARFEREGWERAIAVRDAGTATYALYRPDAGSMRDLFVLSLEGDKLVAVRLQGNLERLVIQALTDRDGFMRTVKLPIEAQNRAGG